MLKDDPARITKDSYGNNKSQKVVNFVDYYGLILSRPRTRGTYRKNMCPY
jgi:hypothetical protein